jgi:hypothetical protein
MMFRRIYWSAFCALLILAAGVPGARAATRTIDTFVFGYNAADWFDYNDMGEVQPVVFVYGGSFTATVEPGGSIQLPDLLDVTIQIITNTVIQLPKSDLSAFLYFPTGGASSLDLIASSPSVPILACAGPAVGLFAPCNDFGRIPGNATASVFIDRPVWTLTLPRIELISSITVPEPSTWTMLFLGLVGMGWSARGVRGRIAGDGWSRLRIL